MKRRTLTEVEHWSGDPVSTSDAAGFTSLTLQTHKHCIFNHTHTVKTIFSLQYSKLIFVVGFFKMKNKSIKL